MKMSIIREIERRLGDHPYLVPIFTHVLDIPKRLQQYNDNLFIVFNGRTEKYEVHSLDNTGDTCCAVLPFSELDIRTIYYVWENDIRVHGKEIFRRIERDEQRAERDRERKLRNWIRDAASEMKPLIAKDAWLGV